MSGARRATAWDLWTPPVPEKVAEVVDACGGLDSAVERWGDRCSRNQLSRLCNEGRRRLGYYPVPLVNRRDRRVDHRLIWKGWDAGTPTAALGLPARALQEA